MKRQAQNDMRGPAGLENIWQSRNILRFFTSDADVHPADNPSDTEDADRGSENGQRLPETGQEGVVIGDDDLAVPHLINYVDCGQSERGATNGVHKSPV